MQTQRGNFLLQALLAMTLVFAFVPFVVRQMASRDIDAQMYASSRQIETAQTAARIYVRENAHRLPYETVVLAGNDFTDTLEPYGLPLGFIPHTPMGQDIALVMTRDAAAVTAHLEITGGGLSDIQTAELARRIGFYANVAGDAILVGLALDEMYSDVVRRNETNLDNGAFLVDLDMGEFSLDGIKEGFARRGEFDTAEIGTLSIVGSENGKKEKSTIAAIDTNKAVFQSGTGESALTLTRGMLLVGSIDTRTVARFGDTGNFTSNAASVYNFSMTAGHTGFTGPSRWDVMGNVVSDNISFSVERLEVKSSLNASRGQDVYISDELEYSSNTGISTDFIAASNITLRDQTSDALMNGQSGAVVLDIRPAGTSLLPDALVDGINNRDFAIIKNPSEDTGDTVDCESIIKSFRGNYNDKSLSQYLVCQYIYWQNLERRIDIMQCMLNGGTNCD